MSSQHTSRQWMVIFVAFSVLAVSAIFAVLYEIRVVRDDITTSLEADPQGLELRAEIGVHHVQLSHDDDRQTCGITASSVIRAQSATYDADGNLTGGYFTRVSGLGSCEGTFWLSLNQLTGQLTTPFKRA